MALIKRIKLWLHARKVTTLRKHALLYMSLLDTQMKEDGVSRSERRRFKHELVAVTAKPIRKGVAKDAN
jgi:hypothetical protein